MFLWHSCESSTRSDVTTTRRWQPLTQGASGTTGQEVGGRWSQEFIQVSAPRELPLLVG